MEDHGQLELGGQRDLGTEGGLYFTLDWGKSWHKWTHGYPTVSTMDLKIQERESALIVGTFGRAIWVLDDLGALRAAAVGDQAQFLAHVFEGVGVVGQQNLSPHGCGDFFDRFPPSR